MSERKGWSLSRRWVRVRIFVAATIFTGCFGLLVYKAWALQVRDHQRFDEMARDQYLRDIELPARRGRLLDRQGAELAVSAEVDSVYANPRQIEAGPGAEKIAAALARPLGMDKAELVKRLSTKRYFAWLKRRALPEEARAVRELNLVGVYSTKEPRRYYPNRSLGGSLLGWASLDGAGIEGVELKYDKELKGAPAEVQGLRDALGRDVFPAPGASTASGDTGPRPGHDLQLTVDKFIQYRLEKALEDGVALHHARAAQAVALDPATGEILAMASVPSVNPNDPTAAAAAAKGNGARNRSVTDPFEPGSTMKAITMTGALEAGVTRLDEHWYCEDGKWQVGSATIHDAERIGDVDTVGVLAKSSNICSAKIACRLGKQRFYEVLRRFGFGAPTGVDLPGERGGILHNYTRWGDVELATIAFGQGVTATQMQLVAAYAALANGGTWYRPHVVKRILDDKGRVLVDVKPEGRRVIDEKLSATMRMMLHAVTEKGGTAEKIAIPGYPAGGKTGTAQKVDPATRRYSPDKWMSSFIGFAPLDQPRVVLMVTVDEPQGVHYGGSVAGPIWREVMLDVLPYLGVQPTADAAIAAAAAQQKAKAPVVAVQQPPAAPQQEDDTGAPAAAAPGDDEEAGASVDVPDFTGLSVGEALDLARQKRLPVEIDGSGRAVGQMPSPGPAAVGSRVHVKFAPPG